MNEEILLEVRRRSRFARHKLVTLVVLTIGISLTLVGVSLGLYNSSGAAQLDLSRPGYEAARNKTITHDSFDSFEQSGRIDEKALELYRKLYDQQMKEVTAVDPFGGTVMSDEALGLGAPVAEQ